MKSKRLKTLIFTGFSAFYSFLSVKLGYQNYCVMSMTVIIDLMSIVMEL